MSKSEPLPSMQALRAFESAARLASFTAAARELGSTQPAVSQQVFQLEAELGVPLFERSPRGVTLTADGQCLYEAVRLSLDTLRADHLDWVAALPERMTLGDDVLMVHGTPDSDLVYFLETVTPDGCRAATPDEIAQRAGDEPASLILCGHTHIPRTAKLDDGRLIVNPGSVGLQAYTDDLPYPHRIETGSPHARYAMVSRTAAGWNVEFHAVEYDWHTAAATAASRGRDDWTVALRTGRC